ncbi:MAG: hypothetical protein R2766_08820 [Saprospiraceae bacterium]
MVFDFEILNLKMIVGVFGEFGGIGHSNSIIAMAIEQVWVCLYFGFVVMGCGYLEY